ncbi:type IV pilin-like G/H family protein [Planktothricoides raciborskii]|uniref:Type IV pilin-like G/H family protein n=1 Tax=Planktothricoides raciborskii FACHB-1370 TaxID=2949576 RepID=A0ABR8E9D7_9CYAN|nr:type IV pilin-like G/H family protein [Planktothricoides raciborskii]MBD2542788.1 type IV pilin-like G/H family protein [Planktothricoides raciborskii FACHB-1370]MBD2581465.1 type IV pilin-like G/H family protein [Planktothricoides raciborskii FACHB-1261]
MSKSKNTEHFTSIFTFDNLPIRLAIYLSVIGAIILPYYVKNNGIFHENTPTEKRMSMERKTIINALNRGQQAHYLERNKFGKSMDEIGLGITKDTGESSYRIVQPMMPVQDLTQSAISDEHESMIMAIGQKNIKKNYRPRSADIDLKNYLGVVYSLPQKSASGETEIIPIAILCQITEENSLPTTMPKLINGEMQCPNASINVYKINY